LIVEARELVCASSASLSDRRDISPTLKESAKVEVKSGDVGGHVVSHGGNSADTQTACEDVAQLTSCAADIGPQLANEMLQAPGTLPEDSELFLKKSAALMSTGALGVDICFGEAAFSAGHLVVQWMAPGTRASRRARELDRGRCLCPLTSETLGNSKVVAALDTCARLRAGADSFESLCCQHATYSERREELQRCFFQVARAASVYVVAPRLAKAEEAGLPPLDLGGSAGWAAQMYANRFSPIGEESVAMCRLFLFENPDKEDPSHRFDPATAYRWSYWQPPTPRNGQFEGRWVLFGTELPPLQRHATTAWKAELKPPEPEGLYAVLAPKQLPWSSSRHEEAVADVYAPRPKGERPKQGKGKGGKGLSKGEGKVNGRGRGRGDGDCKEKDDQVDV